MWNVGIIGCGLIGNKRAQAIKRLSSNSPSTGENKLVLCCDIEISRAQALADRFRAKTTNRWEDVVTAKEVDILIVATVNKYIAPITIEALKNGKHVLCEKPLGRDVKEANEIMNTAEATEVVLKTGFNHRHHPGISRARTLVEQGKIGPLHLIRCRYGHGGRPGYEKEWRADKELSGGGELLDQGVHVVDLFRWFLGDFEECFGYTSNYFWNMDVEDNAFALFKNSKDQVAMMHTSWTQWKNIFSFEIYGDAGYLIVEGLGGSYGTETLRIGKRHLLDNKGTLQYVKGKNALGFATSSAKRAYAGGPPDEEMITFDNYDISWESEWIELISAIEENREPLGSGRDGLEANRMIAAVYASVRENRPMKINEI